MVRSRLTLSVTLRIASVFSCCWTVLPSLVVAQAPPVGWRILLASAKYRYSPKMVSVYTYECSKKLQEINGEGPDKAKQICQCSVTQMQQQYSQSQAIQILTKAQANIKRDPETIPSELVPFFTPCFSSKGRSVLG